MLETLGWRPTEARTSALLLSLSVLAGCAASASVRAVGPTSTARPTPSGSATSTETTGSTGRPDGHGDQICPPTLLDAQADIHPSRRATAAPTTLGVPLGAQAVRVRGYGWLGLNPVDRLLWSRDLGESQTRVTSSDPRPGSSGLRAVGRPGPALGPPPGGSTAAATRTETATVTEPSAATVQDDTSAPSAAATAAASGQGSS